MESLVLTRLMAALSGLPGPTCQRFDPHPIYSNIILMHTEVRQSVRLPTPSKTTNHLTCIILYLNLFQTFLIVPVTIPAGMAQLGSSALGAP